MNAFHCCATCIHYRVLKEQKRLKTYCHRLGYETKPKYQFDCWSPKENVQKLMHKRHSTDAK